MVSHRGDNAAQIRVAIAQLEEHAPLVGVEDVGSVHFVGVTEAASDKDRILAHLCDHVPHSLVKVCLPNSCIDLALQSSVNLLIVLSGDFSSTTRAVSCQFTHGLETLETKKVPAG